MSSRPKKASLGFLRESFMVRRYHTVGHVANQDTVGHHTANVIAIIFFLFDDAPPLYLIKAALHHDAAELATGDMPATTKWAYPKLKAVLDQIEQEVNERQGLQVTPVDEEHAALLKYADMMDLCFKGVEEMASGNDIFAPILARGLHYCLGLIRGELKAHLQANELWALLHSNRFINLEEFIVDFNPEGSTRH